MGDVVAEICSGICGAVGFAFVGALQQVCNATPCGLTICRCCDKACACGCCWKGDKGALPMEDYPGGANHPDTIAAEQAKRQANGEETDQDDGVAPPPYKSATTPTTKQPVKNDGMKAIPSSSSSSGPGGASRSANTTANNDALLTASIINSANTGGPDPCPPSTVPQPDVSPVHHPAATAPTPAGDVGSSANAAPAADYGGSSSGGGVDSSGGGGSFSGGGDSGGGGGGMSSF